ncbi:hypothetical protein HDE_06099 [Halotydeus destructor]|nr:hypothetical protein HDE_06099 [Halotydeus destructor]
MPICVDLIGRYKVGEEDGRLNTAYIGEDNVHVEVKENITMSALVVNMTNQNGGLKVAIHGTYEGLTCTSSNATIICTKDDLSAIFVASDFILSLSCQDNRTSCVRLIDRISLYSTSGDLCSQPDQVVNGYAKKLSSPADKDLQFSFTCNDATGSAEQFVNCSSQNGAWSPYDPMQCQRKHTGRNFTVIKLIVISLVISLIVIVMILFYRPIVRFSADLVARPCCVSQKRPHLRGPDSVGNISWLTSHIYSNQSVDNINRRASNSDDDVSQFSHFSEFTPRDGAAGKVANGPFSNSRLVLNSKDRYNEADSNSCDNNMIV